MSPAQKGEIASLARNELKYRTLAIGDGYNDNLMLRESDIGIKITEENKKKNGTQELLPDIYLAEFRLL